MKKIRLEVIKLNNDDVIATSACSQAFGVVEIVIEDGGELSKLHAYQTGYNKNEEPRKFRTKDSDYAVTNLPNESGYYHFYLNSSGKIVITEVCPAGEDCYREEDYHNIKDFD